MTYRYVSPRAFRCPSGNVYWYPSDSFAKANTDGEADSERSDVERPARLMEPLFTQRLPLWKRAVDVMGASLGLLLLAPLFAIVALAIKATSPGPVLFCQKRSGLGGREFLMLKFRSMVVTPSPASHNCWP